MKAALTPNPSPASGRGVKSSRFQMLYLAAALSLTLLCPPRPLAGSSNGINQPGVRDHLLELQRKAETWRGLRAKRPVKSRTLAEKDLAQEVAKSFREDMPAGTLQSFESALKAFGLVPETLDLAAFLPRLLTQQIAGYYDPEENALSLVRREGGVLAGREDEIGLDAQQTEDMILVHELTHALQDQHFDLAKFMDSVDPTSDAATARQALIEGDATLTMLNALVEVPFEDLPGAEGLFEASMANSGMLMAEGSDELLAEAPPYIRETLLFSYLQGNLFCISVRQKGGQKLLDHAFRSDPPRSSEQILHPEKWHGRRDDPVTVEWPDLGAVLPGFSKVAEGEMGEISVRILLRESLKNEERATTAAAGWGGDRFAVYQKKKEKNGPRLLAWITEWDSADDAAEFAAAAQQLGAGWQIEPLAGQRVIVLRGLPADMAPQQTDRLRERLAKAKARRPANRPIDLAALGIRDEDRAGADPEKLKNRLQDPEFRKRLGEMAGMSEPGEDGEEKAEEKPGVIDAEGRSYTSPSFSIRLPDSAVAAGWKLAEAPVPGLDVMAQGPHVTAWIAFGREKVSSSALSLQEKLPLIEAGIISTLPGYKSLGGKMIETASGPAYENQFEAGSKYRLRGLLRIYDQRGGTMILGIAMAHEEEWEASEPALRSVFDALTPGAKAGE